MKKIFLLVLSFQYIIIAHSQNKLPYNLQNKNQGTYLIRTDNNAAISEDSATIFIRIFGLSQSGCQELNKGTVSIGRMTIDLKENKELELLSDKLMPFEIKPGSYKFEIQTPYSFLLPLKTKKLKFKKGVSYNISFYLVTTILTEE